MHGVREFKRKRHKLYNICCRSVTIVIPGMNQIECILPPWTQVLVAGEKADKLPCVTTANETCVALQAK